MGDSTKSPVSDIEDEDEIKSTSEPSTPTRNNLEMAQMASSAEFKNFISDQLEKQLESSIAKAIHNALEQIQENPPQGARKHRYNKSGLNAEIGSGGESMPDFGNNQNHHVSSSSKIAGKKPYNRRHTSPALNVPLSEDDDSDAESDDIESGDGCCQGTNECIGLVVILLQVGLIILFGFMVKYDDKEVHPDPKTAFAQTNQVNESTIVAANIGNGKSTFIAQYYSQYQDIQVMIFLGIGVLMAFLRKYGYSAIVLSLLAGTFSVQWTILVKGLIYHKGNKIPLTIVSLIEGDFAAAVVLISFGVIIGAATPLQIIFMTFAEVLFYAVNEYIGYQILEAADTGGSIFVHIFAAYFGLAVSRALMSSKSVNAKECDASYNSNLFCIVSVVFLWIFWPSFNSVLSTGNDQHRVVINTMLALFGSCVFSFGFSALFNKNKLVMAHIQNGSLAGGVAVGAAADLMIRPFGALTLGALGGVLCVFGVQFLTPFLSRKMGLQDSCGVHNLHGIPGLLAAFAGVVCAGIAEKCDYGHTLYLRYPARAPFANSTEFLELQKLDLDIQPGKNRTASEQALYQLAAIGVTLVMAVGGGLITGLVMRLPIFGRVKPEYHFQDKKYWVMEDDQVPIAKLTAKVNGISEGQSNKAFEEETKIRRRSKYEL